MRYVGVTFLISSLFLINSAVAETCTDTTKKIQTEVTKLAKSYHVSWAYQRSNEEPVYFSVGKGVQKSSPFLMASVSKMLYAIVALRFVDQGLLSIDDTAEKYTFGRWKDAKLRHVLNHRSGIPEYLNSGPLRMSVAQGYEKIIKALNSNLLFPANDKVAYSNTNYLVLDAWLTQLAGVDNKTLMHEQLFKLAGMSNSGLINQKKPSTIFGSTNAHFANLAGAGNAYSTAEDLLKVLQALENGTLLTSQATSLFLEEDTECKGLTECSRTSLGMSHRVAKIDGKDFVLKTGGFKNTSNIVAWVPSTQQKIVFISDIAQFNPEDLATKWLNALAVCE